MEIMVGNERIPVNIAEAPYKQSIQTFLSNEVIVFSIFCMSMI